MSTVETPGDAAAPNEQAPFEPAKMAAGRPRLGFREWIWRKRALEDANRARDAMLDQDLLRQALEQVELADRLVARIVVLRNGSGIASALLLYRNALLLSAAMVREPNGAEVGAATDEARIQRMLDRVGRTPDSNVGTVEMLLASDAVTVGKLTEEQRGAGALAARALLHEILESLNGKHEQRARLLVQRFFRTGLFIVLLLSLAGGTAALVARGAGHPNLLDHSVMHASSVYAGFSLESGICDGNKTHILFHTNQEENPFVEYDMGRVQQLHHVQIVNRQDCCDERALPLVVETSADGKRFDEVLRRTTPFKKLNETIRPTSARFVRVRALKKTWLHLERVAVW